MHLQHSGEDSKELRDWHNSFDGAIAMKRRAQNIMLSLQSLLWSERTVLQDSCQYLSTYMERLKAEIANNLSFFLNKIPNKARDLTRKPRDDIQSTVTTIL